MGKVYRVTYVPGFWPWKGVVGTVVIVIVAYVLVRKLALALHGWKYLLFLLSQSQSQSQKKKKKKNGALRCFVRKGFEGRLILKREKGTLFRGRSVWSVQLK